MSTITELCDQMTKLTAQQPTAHLIEAYTALAGTRDRAETKAFLNVCNELRARAAAVAAARSDAYLIARLRADGTTPGLGIAGRFDHAAALNAMSDRLSIGDALDDWLLSADPAAPAYDRPLIEKMLELAGLQ